jgi:hypothetical protein
MRAGTSDCCRVTAKALASVSCRWWRLVDLHDLHVFVTILESDGWDGDVSM